jgi:hypothetical protein
MIFILHQKLHLGADLTFGLDTQLVWLVTFIYETLDNLIGDFETHTNMCSVLIALIIEDSLDVFQPNRIDAYSIIVHSKVVEDAGCDVFSQLY